jgi:alpha-glucosidase
VTDPWWRDAVVYEIYLRSFADSDGDGVGDLPAVLDRLPYLRDLGVDAIWLTPFYPSPMHDHGYDVADYCDVEPAFGSLADVDAVLHAAHGAGLRIFVDVVPNHTSSEHPWFREAVSTPTSDKRGWYVFRPGVGGGPPNDWRSVFGGSAWTREETSGEYYLHLFDESQPDLDWRNPQVHAAFQAILRFWLDRGVDGFRIDVAHALLKDPQLRDGQHHAWDQDDVVDIWKEWRQVVDGYDARSFVGEVFLYDMDRVARYVGPDRLHQAFNFSVAKQPFAAEAFATTLRQAIELFERDGTSPTWVLSNHDLVRHPTRYGGGPAGRRRALAATALLLALPGSAYLYQGEELGLEQSDVPPDLRQDPVWLRSGAPGRDGCRTPIPWTATAPGHGFSSGQPWLPFDGQAATGFDVATQSADPLSTWQTYRRALRLRRQHWLAADRRVEWARPGPDTLQVGRRMATGGSVVAVTNFADDPAVLEVPGASGLIFATDAGTALNGSSLALPAQTTAWVDCPGA